MFVNLLIFLIKSININIIDKNIYYLFYITNIYIIILFIKTLKN